MGISQEARGESHALNVAVKTASTKPTRATLARSAMDVDKFIVYGCFALGWLAVVIDMLIS